MRGLVGDSRDKAFAALSRLSFHTLTLLTPSRFSFSRLLARQAQHTTHQLIREFTHLPCLAPPAALLHGR